MDDAELAEGLGLRKEEAFIEAISRFSRLLWIVASRYLTRTDGFSDSDIEECIADVFLDLWQSIERYDPRKGSLKSYLYVLTSRKAISRYRKVAQAKIISFEDIPHEEEPFYEDSIDVADYRALYSAIEQLPEPTREILIRRYFFEEKPALIAEKMLLPKKEIENRLYRAKKSLFHTLSQTEIEALQ